MRMDKLTSKFQMALADAQSLALGRDNSFMEPEHVLLALLDQQDGTCRPLLGKAGVNLTELKNLVSQAVDKLPKVTGGGAQGDVPTVADNACHLASGAVQAAAQGVVSNTWPFAAGAPTNALADA